MKRTALAFAAGAALSLASVAPSSAAPIGQSAAFATSSAIAQSDTNLTDVRYRGRRGHWRGGNGWWVAPLIAAPLLYGAYGGYGDGYGYGYRSYGYGGGNSCWRECRYSHGPEFCRYNWRRYC